MADYLLMYVGGDGKWMERPQEQIKAAMEAWGAWFQRLESAGQLRHAGSPLAPGGAVVSANGGIETDSALPELKELIGGYSVIAADSLEKASELARSCPFLANNPDGHVLVRPIHHTG